MGRPCPCHRSYADPAPVDRIEALLRDRQAHPPHSLVTFSPVPSTSRAFLVISLAACGHGATRNAAPANAIASTDDVRCERAGNIVTTKRVADDAPIIAMFERDPWHSFFDVPTLLVWADGTIFYSEGEYAKTMHFMSSTTASSQVAELSDEIISKLRDAPAETSISDMTDEPSVQLIFRDGAVWRSVDVYGLDARLPETDIPAIARNAFSVYHQLLEWRPSNGQPAPTSFPRPPRWPADLPTYRGQAIIDKLAACAYDVE